MCFSIQFIHPCRPLPANSIHGPRSNRPAVQTAPPDPRPTFPQPSSRKIKRLKIFSARIHRWSTWTHWSLRRAQPRPHHRPLWIHSRRVHFPAQRLPPPRPPFPTTPSIRPRRRSLPSTSCATSTRPTTRWRPAHCCRNRWCPCRCPRRRRSRRPSITGFNRRNRPPRSTRTSIRSYKAAIVNQLVVRSIDWFDSIFAALLHFYSQGNGWKQQNGNGNRIDAIIDPLLTDFTLVCVFFFIFLLLVELPTFFIVHYPCSWFSFLTRFFLSMATHWSCDVLLQRIPISCFITDVFFALFDSVSAPFFYGVAFNFHACNSWGIVTFFWN